MSGENGAKYGKGFAVRMLVLGAVLLLALGGFYYDQFVLAPKNKKIVNDAWGLMTAPDPEGDGIKSDEVQKVIGFAPASTKEEGNYTIERYDFPRVLPVAKGTYLNVVYDSGSLAKIFENEEFTADKMSIGEGFTTPENYKGNDMSGIGLGGGSSSDDDDEDEDEEGDETDDAGSENKEDGN